MKIAALLMLALLFFCIISAIVVQQTYTFLTVETETYRNLRMKVVDATGEGLPNIKVEPRRNFDDGRLMIILEGYSDEEGIFECKVPDGVYDALLSTQGANLVVSPKTFEVTGDTEVTVTAYLIHLKPPSLGGLLEINGIHTIQNFTDMMNVYVSIINYYGLSKNVTIEVWIENSASNRLSTGVINATLVDKETRKVVALPPPPEGWTSGYYMMHGKVYEKVVYSENSLPIKLEIVGVPVWMQWWFWLALATIIGAFVMFYFLKKRKPDKDVSHSEKSFSGALQN